MSSGGAVPGGQNSPLPYARKTARQTRRKIESLGHGNMIHKKERKQFRALTDDAGDIASDMGALATGSSAQQGLAGAQAGADYAGATAGAGANLATNVFLPGAQSLFDMGMDPQNELYDRTLHQTREQQRVGQAARGVSMSPYGAGLENDAIKDFNIDWREGALDRAIRGGGAATNMARSGFDLGNDASQLAASGALLPYSTEMGFKQDEMAANDASRGNIERLANFGTTGNQVKQSQIGNMLQYLGLGPGYQSAATGQQNADMGAIGTVASLFGK